MGRGARFDPRHHREGQGRTNRLTIAAERNIAAPPITLRHAKLLRQRSGFA
jgi:hypothetical protein